MSLKLNLIIITILKYFEKKIENSGIKSTKKRFKAFVEEEKTDNLLVERKLSRAMKIFANIINPLLYLLFTFFYFFLYLLYV